jgi:MoaA/NifB/PqqE/SkfB family radical SAM enzyme
MNAPVSMRQKVRLFGVEYNLTEHCNLSCYQCDHASPLMAKKFASLEDYERDVRVFAQAVHVEEFRLVGGEPLLHPQLIDFMKIARDIGVGDKIKIYTNGMLLHTMPDEFWALTDILWISTYPGIRRRMLDETIAAKCEEHGILLDLRPTITEFNRSCINNRVEDEDLVKRIFSQCKMANEYSCFAIYDGMFFRCSVAPFTQARLRMAGIDFPGPEVDGIRIHGNARLGDEIAARVKSKEPLKSCTYCLGSSGPMIAHRQINRQGCKAWLEEDNRADIDFARRNVRRQAVAEYVPEVAKRTVRKGRKVLDYFSR